MELSQSYVGGGLRPPPATSPSSGLKLVKFRVAVGDHGIVDAPGLAFEMTQQTAIFVCFCCFNSQGGLVALKGSGQPIAGGCARFFGFAFDLWCVNPDHSDPCPDHDIKTKINEAIDGVPVDNFDDARNLVCHFHNMSNQIAADKTANSGPKVERKSNRMER